jgi:hypothetical protein
MDRVLFIGNGVNQLVGQGAGWHSLLNKLAGKPKTQHEQKVRDSKPFTLWYEELQKKSRRKNLKQFVADTIRDELIVHECHKLLMNLKFPVILTSNYDNNLQLASGVSWKLDMAAPERDYSLFRRYVSGDRAIWHIHGEVAKVSSIMLGHKQYTGYLHKIRNYMTSGVTTKVKGRKKKPYLSKFSSSKATYKGDVESWVDHFLGSEVHMVGFGLDYTENHLWNLIFEKQSLKRKNRPSIGSLVFHRCSDKPQSVADEARISLLEAFGVNVIDHYSGSYEEAYRKCIDSLR